MRYGGVDRIHFHSTHQMKYNNWSQHVAKIQKDIFALPFLESFWKRLIFELFVLLAQAPKEGYYGMVASKVTFLFFFKIRPINLLWQPTLLWIKQLDPKGCHHPKKGFYCKILHTIIAKLGGITDNTDFMGYRLSCYWMNQKTSPQHHPHFLCCDPEHWGQGSTRYHGEILQMRW